MKTLILSAQEIRQLIDTDLVLEACEWAFRENGLGRTVMPPKVYLELEQHDGDFRAMPGYVPEAAGCKWVSVHLRNATQGLPTVMAVIVYNDATTGFPLAIMDGTDITNYRTGASGAIAAKHLARHDSESLGLIGSGAQAQAQLAAITALFDFEEILVWSRSESSVNDFIARSSSLKIKSASVREAAGCDIVCTTTPSRQPIVERSWIRPGAHVNAIGADAPGKQELDPAILADAKVIVDDPAQAIHSGEVNVPIGAGIYGEDNIHGTLGEVVAGVRPGRMGPEEITVFDSTGLAIQDVATAKAIYELARKKNLGSFVEFVATANG